ncbi:MAG: hypothetical protein ACI8UO_004907 [Verrucomicrobiales bacterium]|jgi:hypothetical protein
MLTLQTSGTDRNCEGRSRRDLLKIGALGLGGLTLPELLQAKSGGGADFVRNKSVVLLFLGGGASQIETFNPNMSAPSPFRSVTGEVKTNVPGITFGGTFPQLAKHADKMVVVRSYHHKHSNHSLAVPYVLSGGDVFPGGMNSVYARLRGTNHPDSGLPTTSLVTAPDVGRFVNTKKRILAGSQPGDLGSAYAPFDPAGGGPAIENMTLNLPRARLGDRRQLLVELDRLRRKTDKQRTFADLDKFQQQAYDVVLGGAAEAFDLTKENQRTIERYDTGMFRVGETKDVMRSCSLGRQMLLARRLVESGCGFVTVQNSGWDMHGGKGNNFMKLGQGMEMLGRPLDKAVSAFLEDLAQRGLLEQTLLVITGDFGRSPTINKNGGRDHWGNLSTLALAGGGLHTGQVYGQAARNNDVPHSDPVGVENLMSTIMNVLFDVGQLRIQPGMPQQLLDPIERFKPIPIAGVY